MNNEKIKTYDELNVTEKELIDCFRQMKLLSDQSRFELFAFKLENLLEKYETIIQLRKESQAILFDILDEIDKNELSTIDVDYEILGRNREADLNHIAEEIYLIEEYKAGFDEALHMIYSGVAEEILISEENFTKS